MDIISVIICSRDARKFSLVASMYRRLLSPTASEIIHIPDARSMAEGYNRGFERSSGRILLFSHDDVAVLAPDFETRLRGHMEKFDVLGVAGTTRLVGPAWHAAGYPYIFGQVAHATAEPTPFAVTVYGTPRRSAGGIQALDGLFFAAHRHVFERVGFDAERFDGFHLYDVDFTFRAHLAGFRLGVAGDLHVFHASAGNFDSEWSRYAARFVHKHGPRLPPSDNRTHHWVVVSVSTREQILEVMTPAHWDWSD